MSEREDNVYKAKLAEQAERYDGMLLNCFHFQYYPCLKGLISADSAKIRKRHCPFDRIV